MNQPLKTRSAARAIGVPLTTLQGALAREKFDRPMKDESGDFVWLPADIARARKALATDGRRRQPA